ncbi:WGxxGxxG family protein [Lysobacter humi (ex Lee et al. 2017)]
MQHPNTLRAALAAALVLAAAAPLHAQDTTQAADPAATTGAPTATDPALATPPVDGGATVGTDATTTDATATDVPVDAAATTAAPVDAAPVDPAATGAVDEPVDTTAAPAVVEERERRGFDWGWLGLLGLLGLIPRKQKVEVHHDARGPGAPRV